MIKSVDLGPSSQVGCGGAQAQVGCGEAHVGLDIYYAFFSLTAQCVKLNSSNFNKVISIYFNL